ncbi:hypothetical protein [Hallella absiana]|uniref:hypothetical protein n=1 Tax=Hallella absiana TaxID=2925336 RepID=UPI0021C6B469|nr:hypothetical protein [Hallella absiana]
MAAENNDKKQTRREKLAGYFYDISKLTYAALVLGGIVPALTKMNVRINILAIVFGILMSYVFAYFANKILKS